MKVSAKTVVLKDDSPMPQAGEWYSVKMANIPPSYLLWLYDNNRCTPAVKEYIKKNLELLRAGI